MPVMPSCGGAGRGMRHGMGQQSSHFKAMINNRQALCVPEQVALPS